MTTNHTQPLPYRVALRRRWNAAPDNSARYRLWRLACEWRRPWWDFGNRLMILTGVNSCGNFEEPEPPTWFYREAGTKRQWRTGFPRPVYEVVTSYREFRDLTADLDPNGDVHYEWKAFCTNQDGDLQFGRMFWGGKFYGLNSWEQRLLTKYLRQHRRRIWWGARSWLFLQGLHAAVHKKRPGACQQVPPKGSGGYSHWHCTLDRGHTGPHRFSAMEWDADGGEVRKVDAT